MSGLSIENDHCLYSCKYITQPNPAVNAMLHTVLFISNNQTNEECRLSAHQTNLHCPYFFKLYIIVHITVSQPWRDYQMFYVTVTTYYFIIYFFLYIYATLVVLYYSYDLTVYCHGNQQGIHVRPSLINCLFPLARPAQKKAPVQNILSRFFGDFYFFSWIGE